MKVEFINPIIASCQNIMASVVGIHLTPGQLCLRHKNQPVSGYRITGLIDMQGDHYKASFAIIFKEESLKQVASRIANQPLHEVDAVVLDLAGEFSNMILGAAKSTWEQGGYQLNLSLPTIILGSDYLISHKTQTPVLTQEFKHAEIEFKIEASFEGEPPEFSVLETAKEEDITLF